MKLKKAECKSCSTIHKVKLYWSSENLLKVPLKTHYCDRCARMAVPNEMPLALERIAK